MQPKASLLFEEIKKIHLETRVIFLELSKQLKSKKAASLYARLELLELYAELLGMMYVDQKELSLSLFQKFQPLKKDLKKIVRLKKVEVGMQKRQHDTQVTYGSYAAIIASHKKGLYAEVFDRIVGTTLTEWDHYLHQSQLKNQKPPTLSVHASVQKLMLQELDCYKDWKNQPDSKSLKDLHLALRRIQQLENLLQTLGFNPFFPDSDHLEIQQVLDTFDNWSTNHLELQSLAQFVAARDQVSKKYLHWVYALKREKKNLSSTLERQAQSFFEKILS